MFVDSPCKMCTFSLPVQIAGEGPMKPKLIVVGNAPTKDDERTGVPFSGSNNKDRVSSSLIIRNALRSMQYDPYEEIYYSYAMRCNPYHRSQKMDVKPSHVNICRTTNLEAELAKVDCPVILGMGTQALQSLLPDAKGGIGKNRGKWHEVTIGGRKRLVRITYDGATIDRMSLYRAEENEYTNKIVRATRIKPVGSVSWFFENDLRALKQKLFELGLGPDKLMMKERLV